MAYKHQWRRAPELDREGFTKAVEDIRLILDRIAELGVNVAGPTGYGKPELTTNTIAFNGVTECGHRFYDYGEPWPADDAEGVFNESSVADAPYWSGESLTTRTCHGGTCSQKPFIVDRQFMTLHWTKLEKGGYFCKCETLFKPYDLAVTAALIRLKEHLSDEIWINSDGGEKAFEDAKRLCRELFGWARHFQIEPTESEIV